MTKPTSHLDKARLNNLADEIWKSAERLRGKFKAHEYKVVILPIITIRRLECVLIKWREQKAGEIRSKRKDTSDEELEKLVKSLELNPRQSPGFSNATTCTPRKICEEDHTLPRVDIQGKYYLDDEDMAYDTDRDNRTVGMVFNWDIFTGFSRSAQVKKAEAMLDRKTGANEMKFILFVEGLSNCRRRIK